MGDIRNTNRNEDFSSPDGDGGQAAVTSQTVELVEKAAGGNMEAFGELYSLYVDQIYRYVYYRVRNQMLAEDVTEEVFVKAWKSIKSCKGKGQTFMAWLYRIARNQMVDNIRKLKRETPLPDYDITSTPVYIDSAVDASLKWQEVAKVIATLAPSQEQVITLKFIEGLENHEIAEIMGKSEGAVRILQMRALTNIKQAIKED